MAEVATGVLHNVGNVLTSVNVGIELIEERVTALPAERLRRAATLMESAKVDPGKLATGVTYIGAIADHLETERQWLHGEITTLRGHVEHVKRVIAMQNRYARTAAVSEQVALGSIVSEAIAFACPEAERHHIELTRDVSELDLTLDRHRVLQILVNLLANARDSLSAHEQSGAPGPLRLTIAAKVGGGMLELAVTDTGGGIAPDVLPRVFTAGFTTKPKGHGYGLHSSALAAEQLGGELTCASAGLGQGAHFVLRIPVQEAKPHG
jgi:signal transduction histidine kinase